MHCRTLQGGRWIVLALCSLGSAVSAQPPSDTTDEVTISIFNDASVPAASLQKAEQVASAVFVRANLRLHWLNCGRTGESLAEEQNCSEASFPTHLHVRLIRGPLNTTESILGLSYIDNSGVGCQADISYRAVSNVAQESRVNISTVPGITLVHEIGHLLLGANSHSPEGIMRAHWSSGDVGAASKGQLLFMETQREQLKSRLDSRAQARLAGVGMPGAQ